ncbi:MAG: tRNA (adenosine(37)-N6)-dimethylallyltransferase MiaA [Lachnospiraceae bacterium]|nr:tRNA (adenosine(37)-N6)-dimethylallyltransferase MiaA [Lachnospiraceae bacterium]
MGNKLPLIFIGGTTASGKSETAVELALRLGGEVVSCDSAQVYRHMDIGTAKIRPEEMRGVPHHLIDVADPRDAMSAARYKEMAVEAINGICERGRIPVMVGGTPFYAQGVLYDIDFGNDNGRYLNVTDGSSAHMEDLEGKKDPFFSSEQISDTGRAATKSEEDMMNCKEFEKLSPEELYARLSEVDPDSAKVIHKNNIKRVIRALEFFYETGERISEHNREQRQNESPYDLTYFAIVPERELIYQRTDRRVDRMIEEGLEKEVRELIDMGCTADMVSMKAIGYRQMISYIMGECSLEEAVDEIKKSTRHFAKRQITWLNREKDAVRVSSGEEILTRYK